VIFGAGFLPGRPLIGAVIWFGDGGNRGLETAFPMRRSGRACPGGPGPRWWPTY